MDILKYVLSEALYDISFHSYSTVTADAILLNRPLNRRLYNEQAVVTPRNATRVPLQLKRTASLPAHCTLLDDEADTLLRVCFVTPL